MTLCDELHEKMDACYKNLTGLRVKAIPFRDYTYDGWCAMDNSGFFSLPEEREKLLQYIEGIPPGAAMSRKTLWRP